MTTTGLREQIMAAMEKLRVETDKHFIDKLWILGIGEAADEILGHAGMDGPGSTGMAEPEAVVPHIFLDCDGVLADFDGHGFAVFGMTPRRAEAEMGAHAYWKQLQDRGDFYRTMPLMPGARELYEGVRHLSPTILTGCPRGGWAEAQKVAWAEEHFPGVPIITCRSADKREHMTGPGDVLIDDWPQHRHRWIEAGGVFISHYDAASSLAALWAHYPPLAASRATAEAERQEDQELCGDGPTSVVKGEGAPSGPQAFPPLFLAALESHLAQEQS